MVAQIDKRCFTIATNGSGVANGGVFSPKLRSRANFQLTENTRSTPFDPPDAKLAVMGRLPILIVVLHSHILF